MNTPIFKRRNGTILLPENDDLLIEELEPYGMSAQAFRLGRDVPAIP